MESAKEPKEIKAALSLRINGESFCELYFVSEEKNSDGDSSDNTSDRGKSYRKAKASGRDIDHNYKDAQVVDYILLSDLIEAKKFLNLAKTTEMLKVTIEF